MKIEKLQKEGGEVAKVVCNYLEKKLGEFVISSNNSLYYKYVDNNLIDSK